MWRILRGSLVCLSLCGVPVAVVSGEGAHGSLFDKDADEGPLREDSDSSPQENALESAFPIDAPTIHISISDEETSGVFRTVQESRPVQPVPADDGAERRSSTPLGSGSDRDLLSRGQRSLAGAPGADRVSGSEASENVTTDAGDLLGRSPSALSVVAQRRTPIVNDPRIRGNRVGALLASGSYWVPARIDLDTMLNKIDSRLVRDMVVIGGPYTTRLGPGFSFVDVEMLGTPRYEEGCEWHGTSNFDYRANGEQLHGRQSLWGGGQDYGYRVGYGHRTGNDYRAGDGEQFASSYNSRELDFALGRDLTEDSSLEFQYLRLDQTGVEFPGFAFDMNFLVTDGYEVTYVLENQNAFDRLEVEAWYNRTRFAGDNLSPRKDEQFPFFGRIQFVAATDVDSMSTGYRAAATWGLDGCPQLTAGADLRFIKQELNEIASGRAFPGPGRFNDVNSPIPDSYIANPGFFVEHVNPLSDDLTVTAGVRADTAAADINEIPAVVGPQQTSYAAVVGTDEFHQNFSLWSAFVTTEYEINPCWTLHGGCGYAERPPTLTELYAAEPFMFLLQNGLNTVTGDPRLDPERAWQIDLGLTYDNGTFRGGINGYHAWLRDYITFENLRTFPSPDPEQVNLKYVNTDRATLAGAELYGEFDLNCWLTPFATAKYVEGRDQTRNGTFATRQATSMDPSIRVPGLPRGDFSGIAGAAEEPLPGIAPLDSRLGIRIHQPCEVPAWSIQISTRIVDNQDRVATSLLESQTPGFTVWDVRGFWQINDALLLVAGVENFGDRTYREHLDFRALSGSPQLLQPGANFYTGVEWTY